MNLLEVLRKWLGITALERQLEEQQTKIDYLYSGLVEKKAAAHPQAPKAVTEFVRPGKNPLHARPLERDPLIYPAVDHDTGG